MIKSVDCYENGSSTYGVVLRLNGQVVGLGDDFPKDEVTFIGLCQSFLFFCQTGRRLPDYLHLVDAPTESGHLLATYSHDFEKFNENGGLLIYANQANSSIGQALLESAKRARRGKH